MGYRVIHIYHTTIQSSLKGGAVVNVHHELTLSPLGLNDMQAKQLDATEYYYFIHMTFSYL